MVFSVSFNLLLWLRCCMLLCLLVVIFSVCVVIFLMGCIICYLNSVVFVSIVNVFNSNVCYDVFVLNSVNISIMVISFIMLCIC